MAQKSVKAEFSPQVTDGLLHMKAYSKEMLTKLIIYKCNWIFYLCQKLMNLSVALILHKYCFSAVIVSRDPNQKNVLRYIS